MRNNNARSKASVRSDSSLLPARAVHWAIQLVSEPTPKVSHGSSRGSGPPRPGPPLLDPHLLPRHEAPPAQGCRWRPGPRPPAAQGGRHRHARPRSRKVETYFPQDKAKPCPGVSPRSAAATAPLTSHAEQRHGGPGSRPRLSSCRPADTGRRRRLSRGGAVPPGQGRVTTDASGGARGRPGWLRSGAGLCCLGSLLFRLLFRSRRVRELDGGGTPWMCLRWSARTGSAVLV